MTAPDKIWAWWYSDSDRDNYPTIERKWDDDDPIKHQPWLSEIEMPPTEFIRFALHQSALDAKDREIERLRELLSVREITVKDSTEIRLRMDAKDATIARLQARLKACPTVEQLREWQHCSDCPDCRECITETANRMESANAE